MSWSEVSTGKFRRNIGENETFIKLIGDPGIASGREHWAINSSISFKVVGSLTQAELPILFLKPWKILRFHHPSVAAYAINDTTLEYNVPDRAVLNDWAAETFRVVNDQIADEVIPTLKPSRFATLVYLPRSTEVLCHTSHWRTDGIGVLLLLDALLDLVSTPDLSNPETLAWGQEVGRLTPSIEEAANIPVSSTPAIKARSQNYVETFYRGAGALGIPCKAENETPPGGTRSTRLCLSPDETTFITSQCKAKSISVTSAIHASVAAASYAVASNESKGRHFTSTIRFSLRPYLPEPYSTPSYASGLYTTGWMHTIPASASWIENAKAYNDEYRKGLNTEFIESYRQYALDLSDLIRNMPEGGDPPSNVDISSVGVVEKLVDRVKGTDSSGLEIRSVSVGVEILTRQCVCFVWTFRDQLNLNLVYNEAYHDDADTTNFLNLLKSILLKQLE